MIYIYTYKLYILKKTNIYYIYIIYMYIIFEKIYMYIYYVI